MPRTISQSCTGDEVKQDQRAGLALLGEEAHRDEDAGDDRRAAREVEEEAEDLGRQLVGPAQRERVEEEPIDDQDRRGDDVAGHRPQVGRRARGGRSAGWLSLRRRRLRALGELQEDRLEPRGPPVDPEQIDAVADQRPRHLGAQIGRARQESSATPSPSRMTVHSPMPVTVRATSMARLAAPTTSTSIVPPPPSWRGQILLAPLGDDLAVLDDQQAVAGLADLREDVAREEDGVLPAEHLDGRAHLDDLHRVEAAGRLVEDQELGLVHQRLGHADALPVAVRQAGDQLVVHLAGGGLLLRFGHRARRVAGGDAAQLRGEGQVPPDGHLAVERRRVGEKPDAAPHLVRIARDVDPVDGHLAGGRQQHAAEDLQRRGLAGAVEAEKADDLAAIDREVEVVDGGVLAVVLGQSFDFNHE